MDLDSENEMCLTPAPPEEELIELVEIKSPKKNNKIDNLSTKYDRTYSISSANSITESEDNIKNIFSVNPTLHSRRPSSSDRRTISEISDDVFLVKSEPKQSNSVKNFQKNYKEKISEHLKKIKEKAINSSDLVKSKFPIERIRRESEHLNLEINNVRSKLKSRENREADGFFTFVQEQKEEENNSSDGIKQIYYDVPEKLDFTMHLAEKDCFLYPNRKWFIKKPQLTSSETPMTRDSLRPSNYSVNDQNLTKYVPSSIDVHAELSELVVIKDNILDVYLSRLKFCHHPLFSAENVFAEKLKSAFREYREIQEGNVLEKLKEHLSDLRDNQADSGDEIKKARLKYFKENKRYKESILTSLETWKHVKKIRGQQKYSNTNIKLLIKKDKINCAAEIDEFKNLFQESLKEILKERGCEEIDEFIDEESEIKSIRDSGGDDSITSASLSKNEDTKKQQIKYQLRKTFKSCFKTPGEPNIQLALATTNEITENPDHIKEISRRNIISSTKFYLRILCNEIEACKTKFLNLNKDFCLEINEIFSLQLTDVPKFLTIEVYEQPKSLLRRKLCDINIDIPVGKSSMKILKSSFSKTDIVHYKHEGVGTGVELDLITENYGIKLINLKNHSLKTCGYLEYGLEWEKENEIHLNTNDLEAKFQELDRVIDQNFVIDYNKFNKFLEADVEIKNPEKNEFFRLNPHYLLTFCHISEIEENIRLKILQLRDQKEIEFDGMLVPNRLKEVPLNILSQYLRRKSGEKKGFNTEEIEDIKSQYSYGKKFLQQVHLKIFQLCKNIENNLDYESVVNEKYFIYFHLIMKTLLRNFFNWFSWRPKLSKPLPILSQENADNNLEITKTNLYLTVKLLGAKNVPNRKKLTFNEEGKEENEVCPFVEVNYKNVFVRSGTSRGCNPVWGENLVIPLESTHMDYLNPNSLEGVISINLFDESEIEIKKLNKKCVNWLGSVEILLSAVCCSNNISGFFQIRTPHMLLDYETHGEKSNKLQKMSTSTTVHTYVDMKISIEPSVPKLCPNMEELPCGDLPYIQEHVLKWNRTYNSSYPHRKFDALVLDTNGKTNCVTRFFKALEPPQINTEEFDVTVEQCCRYVSLIPFTLSNHFYSNIWLSTDQLINFMLGSIIDHAIALTCYITALKLDAWLLLGYGIPHGNTAYVLLPDYTGDTPLPVYYIIDVVYNEKYNIMDENCPLQKIFCVINGKNVWGNTQNTDNITLTRFDFNRHSDWLPLFNNTVAAPTNYIGNKVVYRDKEDMEMLEMNLEKMLKRQLSKLRLLDRTMWNTGLSSVLSNFLKTFELNCMYNRSHLESVLELNQEISQYTVSGFAINTHLTSFSNLVKKIKRLGIHIQQEKDVEFSLAAYIHSYPGRLFSVWIFLVNVRNSD